MNVPDEKPGTMPPMVSMSADPMALLLRDQVLDPPGRPGIAATLDRLDILRVLGEGAMGTVLLGRHPSWPYPVAIKVLKPPQTSSPAAVHRFLIEARHMQRLAHPHILPIEEVVDRAGGPYFIVPYCEKGSLQSLINQAGHLEGEQALHIARQIADALNFAHGRGIIHRDLKPANVLLRSDGNAFLADFGLGKTTLVNESITDVTRLSVVGTAPYMSPEVAEGTAGDFRCDIYSFGAMFYEMLCGVPPYEGTSSHEILAKVRAGPPVPLEKLQPNVPRVLLRIVEGCMERDLRDRYASMSDVLADLERVATGKAPFGPRGGKARRANREAMPWRSLQRRTVLLSVAAIVIAISLALWFAWPLIVQSPIARKEPQTQPATVTVGTTREETLLPMQLAPADPPVLGRWVLATPSPHNGYMYDAVPHNGYLYVPGGYDGAPLSSVYYVKTNADGSLGDWKPAKALPVADPFPGTAMIDGYLYISYSAQYNQILMSAPIMTGGELDAWRSETAPPSKNAFGGKQLREFNGRLYQLGGWVPNSSEFSTETWFAAPDVNGHLLSWNANTPLPEKRGNSSVHFFNNRVYIVGGITTGNTLLDSAYSAPVSADGTLGTWRQEARFPTAIWQHSSVLIDGSIFVFGGMTGYNRNKSKDIFRGSIDNGTGTIHSWINVGPMPSEFSIQPGAAYDPSNRTVYLIGGNQNPAGPLSATSQVWAARVGPQVTVESRIPRISQSSFQIATLTVPFDEKAAKDTQQAWANYLAPDGRGQVQITNTLGMKLALIPPGTFNLGTPAQEAGRSDDEGPQHKVTITRAFYMATTEVTQAQWKSVMGANNNPSHFKGDNLPVEQVSWSDAVDYCKRLSQKEGTTYRLPTEAEWEYACRAGTIARFYAGDDDNTLELAGWHRGNSGGKTHAVGQKAANAFGLHDMHGNVWEWCNDWYGPYAANDQIDPSGPANGQYRVMRGGSWSFYPRFCRSGDRISSYAPIGWDNGIGFRVVMDSH